MTARETLIKDGWVPVDLKAGNVNVGDSIANSNMFFARLKNITKKGNYMVRFDMDYYGEPMTRFTPEQFERIFLVKKKDPEFKVSEEALCRFDGFLAQSRLDASKKKSKKD